MKKILSKLCGGVLLFSLSMSLTSCEGALDDILGEWSRPTPGSSTGGGSDSGTVTAATITTAPTATAGDILAGSTTALVTAGVADGGTLMYKATSDNTQPTSTDGFSVEIPTAATNTAGTYYIWYYAKAADAQHSDSEIAATPVKVSLQPTLSTPLTVEAITAGKIIVTSPKAGMKYSLNGGAKTAVTATPIDVAAGKKVEFYGNGTSITKYEGTKIGGDGDGFKCKVYGNIMSLVDEAGFADNKTLPESQTFKSLFMNNEKLTDASGLLLPATTLEQSCYFSMFEGCTSLTTAPKELPAVTLKGHCYLKMFYGCKALTETPKLPATTLQSNCYLRMFDGCTNLTTAYVKAAYKSGKFECSDMFAGCTNAAGSTFYSKDAATADTWRSTFGLSSWASGVYPTE